MLLTVIETTHFKFILGEDARDERDSYLQQIRILVLFKIRTPILITLAISFLFFSFLFFFFNSHPIPLLFILFPLLQKWKKHASTVLHQLQFY